MGSIIFVTGTDTGVGKTLLTTLLLGHLRAQGTKALAMKPFCSGDRQDVELIQALQDYQLPMDQVNPFYYPEPIAPLLAARKHRRQVYLPEVVQRIHKVSKVCDCLLVEGCGGIFVPLGHRYTVADLIDKLRCRVVVVARNQLGTLNHTLLTAMAINSLNNNGIRIVLMGQKRADETTRFNAPFLLQWLAPIKVFNVKYLGRNVLNANAIKNKCKKMKKILAHILA